MRKFIQEWWPILLAGLVLAYFFQPRDAQSAEPGELLDPKVDYRYCGEPDRDADGTISRSRKVVSAFRKLYACPDTQSHVGPCPGWSVDHVIPLAVGGCDSVTNLQWLPNKIKSSSDDWAKDRWERKVYAK